MTSITPRQRETLEAVARCGSTRAAAAELGVAESTVKNTLLTLRRKLGVHSTLQALWLLERAA